MDTPLNIVVVEDHDALREVTVEALRGMGYVVTGVNCAEAVDDELGNEVADLFVIDLNLPGEDGMSLARRIRQAQPQAGIVMVTARVREADKLDGYESGADIYLTKPTSMPELAAAVRALGRRVKAPAAVRVRYLLDTRAMMLRTTEETQETREPIGFSVREVAMLAALARAPSRRLEYWQLLELAGPDVTKAALEVQIVRLRK